MDSCDGNGQHNMGGYTESSVIFLLLFRAMQIFIKIAIVLA